MVTIDGGALVRIRINQTLDSGHTQPGTRFDGVVVNDVVAGGAVAIPRGAMVQGIVVDAKSSGTLAGRGELSLQLTQVTLGGRNFPIVSSGSPSRVANVGRKSARLEICVLDRPPLRSTRYCKPAATVCGCNNTANPVRVSRAMPLLAMAVASRRNCQRLVSIVVGRCARMK